MLHVVKREREEKSLQEPGFRFSHFVLFFHSFSYLSFFIMFRAVKSLPWPSISRQIRFITTRPQTIYALSSSPGKAGVAVIRISGNNAKQVCNLVYTDMLFRYFNTEYRQFPKWPYHHLQSQQWQIHERRILGALDTPYQDRFWIEDWCYGFQGLIASQARTLSNCRSTVVMLL